MPLAPIRLLRYTCCRLLPAAAVLLATVGSAPAEPPSVPLLIGGDALMDACGSVGEVRGLNPHGDNYLAVRSGPGTEFAMRDQLHEGDRVILCSVKGEWLGIVYGPEDVDCGVATPLPESVTYAGPCRWGWVASRWILVLAG